jgi:hypothetical protein
MWGIIWPEEWLWLKAKRKARNGELRRKTLGRWCPENDHVAEKGLCSCPEKGQCTADPTGWLGNRVARNPALGASYVPAGSRWVASKTPYFFTSSWWRSISTVSLMDCPCIWILWRCWCLGLDAASQLMPCLATADFTLVSMECHVFPMQT